MLTALAFAALVATPGAANHSGRCYSGSTLSAFGQTDTVSPSGADYYRTNFGNGQVISFTALVGWISFSVWPENNCSAHQCTESVLAEGQRQSCTLSSGNYGIQVRYVAGVLGSAAYRIGTPT